MKERYKKGLGLLLTGTLLAGALTGCGGEPEPVYIGQSLVSAREIQEPEPSDKYRTFYEIFVYSFWDSNADGVGDLAGVTEKLDYLNDGDSGTDSDLGITGIWLMPIMPPNTYHKYDVKDYMAIDPAYGTMEDFENLVTAAKERNINVIIDLVMNHTSSAHPWFVEACDYLRSIGDGEPDSEVCPYVDYYHFNKGMKWGYSQVAGTDWYYEAGFWSEMPDLNLHNENVREEFEEICRFWLDKGVAGFRLDAVKEFVSGDTEANVEILTWFNTMVKEMNPDAYLVGEAWTSRPEYAKYYASGIDSLFDFSLAGSGGYINKLASGLYRADTYGSQIAGGDECFSARSTQYVNAPINSNHDMDRQAGYYSGEWAGKQVKLAAALNLTMSGNAFLYYGDEIGMLGKGKDENKRLAMRWTADAGAVGMCHGPVEAERNISQIYPALEEQMEDTYSLYTYYKNLIRLRNQFPSIRKGSTEQLDAFSDNEVCALLKTYEDEKVVLFYNMSAQVKTIDLSAATLNDGAALEGKMLEATLVSGETPVSLDGQLMTMPEYSVAVLEVQ